MSGLSPEFEAMLEIFASGEPVADPHSFFASIFGRNRVAKKKRVAKRKLVTLLDSLRAGPWAPSDGWKDKTFLRDCKALINAGLSEKTLPLAVVAVELLRERAPDTVRGIMYAVVSSGWLPNTSRKSYMRVQRILNVLRKKRVIPFEWITDNIRSTEKPSSWSGLSDYADTVKDCYRRDFWASLPDYVCVIVEKDTAAGRILPITREYDVPLHPLRGFSSTTFSHAIGEQWREIQKPIHCYYIGDHDPSGREIERSIRLSLREYAGRKFTWTRLAVEPHHFDQFNIIPLEPKRKDTRYQRFADEYGDKCAEVEAVPADALRQMVEGAIRSHIPSGEWERLQQIEAKEREQWHKVIGKLRGVA